MGNPLYQNMMQQQFGMGSNPMQFSRMNPAQKMQMAMQAMQNPAQFVKQLFPDIPDEIMNDPAQIRQYLQKTRGFPGL